MKDLEKMLNSEFDARIKPMSEKLKNHPITTEEITKPKFSFYKVVIPMLSFMVVFVLAIFIVGLNKDVKDTYVIEVNPSVIITTENDKITSIKSANKDGDLIVLGLDVESLVGMNVDEGVVIIVDEYIKLGYFNKNDQMTVSSVNGDNKTLESTLIDYVCQRGYYVAVFVESLDLESYNASYNTSINSIDEFISYVEELKTYEIESSVPKNLSEDEIAQKYKKDYLEHNIKKLIEEEYNNILKAKETIVEIYNTYYEILSDSTINFIIRDYWYLLEKYDSLSESAKQKIDKMKQLLIDYKALTNEEISSINDLLDLENIVSTFTEKLDKLYNLMTEAAEMISSNMYEDWMNSLDNYLQDVNLSKYIEIPKTSEELVGKVKELYMESRNKYINDNKSDYESTKNPITESDYQKFLNSFNKIK